MTLVIFFRYNVFSTKHKIFLGDTGSLITGLVIAVLTIKFLESEPQVIMKYPVPIHATPSMAIGILVIPLFDTLRVFILRLWNRKSPFKADRNHIHHRLLSLGFTLLEVTVIMITFNLLVFVIAILLQDLGDIFLIILFTLLGVLFSYLSLLILRYRLKNQKIQQHGN